MPVPPVLVWGALALCMVLLVAAVYVPGFAAVLNLHDPGPDGWVLVGVMSTLPTVIGQAVLSAPLLRRGSA